MPSAWSRPNANVSISSRAKLGSFVVVMALLSAELDGKRLEASERDVRLPADPRAGREPKAREAAQEPVDRDRRLEPRQRRANAEVDPMPEGDVAGVGARDVEAI